MGELYQTAFYGLPSDVPLAGKWIARCANGDLPLPSVGCTILQALPTNTRRPTRTPEPTGTPTPITTSLCQIAPSGFTSLFSYRAPIRGNPVEHRFTASSTNLFDVDGYAIDPMTDTLWFHINNVPTSNQLGWIEISSPDGDIGSIVLPINVEGSLNLSKDIIQSCLNKIPDWSIAYPVANVPWRLPNTPIPQVFRLPVSGEQICFGTRFPNLETTRLEVHGFGYNPFGIAYDPPGRHMGVDFFVPVPNLPAFSSGVYSLADNGIVVGIGMENESKSSGYNWGASEIFDGNGYNIIIRYGDLYVVYGHLREIDANIYVGVPVNSTTRLGAIGQFNEPHLHLEIRSFGSSIRPNALVKDRINQDNKYGILKLGSSQAINVYDITQFFTPDSVTAFISDFASNSTPSPLTSVTGLGFSIQDRDPIVVGNCSSDVLTYFTAATNSVGGYRGFILGVASPQVPYDLRTPSNPPPIP